MKNLFYFLLVLSLSISACRNDDDDDVPMVIIQDLPIYFSDGFETTTNDLNLLFPEDGSRWTNLQQVDPNSGNNEISLTGERNTEGVQGLRFLSRPGDDVLSKADIEKGGMYAPAGSLVTIEADFYLEVAADISLENLFLIDLECCACWDPSVDNNQCPGVRLTLSGTEEYLVMERGKIGGETLVQTNQTMPRNRWTKIKWSMRLSPDEDGLNQVFIDDQEILNFTGMNLPNADIFRDIGSSQGIDFELQTPVAYERIQIGATANASPGEVTVFIDNFSIAIEE